MNILITSHEWEVRFRPDGYVHRRSQESRSQEPYALEYPWKASNINVALVTWPLHPKHDDASLSSKMVFRIGVTRKEGRWWMLNKSSRHLNAFYRMGKRTKTKKSRTGNREPKQSDSALPWKGLPEKMALGIRANSKKGKSCERGSGSRNRKMGRKKKYEKNKRE